MEQYPSSKTSKEQFSCKWKYTRPSCWWSLTNIFRKDIICTNIITLIVFLFWYDLPDENDTYTSVHCLECYALKIWTNGMCHAEISVQWENISYHILPLKITYLSLVELASLSHWSIDYFKCIICTNVAFAFPRINPRCDLISLFPVPFFWKLPVQSFTT